LLESPADKSPESWSPDGKTLFYQSGVLGKSKYAVWALSFEAGASPVPVLDNGFNIDEAQISPDARWLAYISDESGQWEVYLQVVGRPGERVRVSTAGGGQPKWRGDSKELFYLSGEGRLMAVAVKAATPSPEVGLPVALFDLAARGPVVDDYAPSADGQRFLVKAPVSTEAPRIHVAVNWPSLLSAGTGRKGP
jgi:Tol biopolymer transport system component